MNNMAHVPAQPPSRPRQSAAASLAVVFVLLVSGGRPMAQPAELPGYLQATFEPLELVADTFRLPVQGQGTVSARIFFQTESQEVGVHWLVQAEAHGPDGFKASGDELELFATSFQPTAVCREAGQGDAFFVAGFVPRTGAVVVERWSVRDPEVHVLTTPITDPTQPSPPPPARAQLSKRIRRELVLSTTELQPLKTIAFNPVGQHLIAIDMGANAAGMDASAVTIDVQSGNWETPAQLAQLDALRYYHNLRLFISSSNGLTLLVDRRPAWLFLNPALSVEAVDVLLVRDPDLTGGYPVVEVGVTYEEIAAEGYLSDVVTTYTSPWP